MTNVYLRISWGSALAIGITLVLTGVVGLFVPLVPEIAIVLLGVWLLRAAAANPLGQRWKLINRMVDATTKLHN